MRHRKIRHLRYTAFATVVAMLIAWLCIPSRHALLRAVTELERVSTAYASRSSEAAPSLEPTVYAHRARTSMSQSDNSSIGIESCVTLRCPVEVDVFFSRDGVPFIGYNTGVDHLDAARLDSMKLADGSGYLRFSAFSSSFLPRLPAVLIDVKTGHDNAAEKAATIAALLRPFDTRHRLTILSLSGVFLMHLKRLRPDVSIACESYLVVANYLAGFDAVSLQARDINAARDALARRVGLRRIYFTATTPASWHWLRAWAPDGVIVNLHQLPELAR